MQEFTAYAESYRGHEFKGFHYDHAGNKIWNKQPFCNSSKNTYELPRHEFEICFSPEIINHLAYHDYRLDSHNYREKHYCQSRLKAIMNTFKNKESLAINYGKDQWPLIINSKELFQEYAGLPKNPAHAEVITGLFGFVDNPYDKKIDYEKCKQCTPLMLAKYKEKQSERSYLEFKNETSGWWYSKSKSEDEKKQDTKKLNQLKKKCLIRQQFLKDFKAKIKNQLGKEKTKKQ